MKVVLLRRAWVKIFLLSLLLIIIGCLCPPDPISATVPASECRALLVGNWDYWGDSNYLPGVAGDIMRMENVLSKSTLSSGQKHYNLVKRLTNATGQEMLAALTATFKDAAKTDVSLFYFVGHGAIDTHGRACLCAVDAAYGGYIRVDELEQALRQIPGTKVVVLDCCYSGGFVYPRVEEERAEDSWLQDMPKEYLADQFNNAVLATFSANSKSSLGRPEYKVLTACAADESSFEVYDREFNDYGGEFSSSFVKGAGFIGGDYRADADGDHVVTLDEMYKFTSTNVLLSAVQVYPHGDPFVLVRKYNHTYDYEEFPLDAAVGTDVELNRGWEIKFNKSLRIDTVNGENIYIGDVAGNVVPAIVGLAYNDKTVHLVPSVPYKGKEMYSIYITPKVMAQDASCLQTGVLVTFQTCAVDVKAPQGLLVKALSDSTVELYWDPVVGADYYHVYRSFSVGGPFVPYLNDDGSNRQAFWAPGRCLTITGFEPNTTVFFRLTAVKNGAESDYSNIVQVTTLPSYKNVCLQIVQGGAFVHYPYPAVQVAFENFFSGPVWKYFISTKGEHVVEFNGLCYYGSQKVLMIIQFLVDPDTGYFEVGWAGKNGNTITQSELLQLLNAVYNSYRAETFVPSLWHSEKTDEQATITEDQEEVSLPAVGEIKLKDKEIQHQTAGRFSVWAEVSD